MTTELVSLRLSTRLSSAALCLMLYMRRPLAIASFREGPGFVAFFDGCVRFLNKVDATVCRLC